MRKSLHGTYLLRDGRACDSAWPICFDRMQPPPRGAGKWPGGLWAEVPNAASGDPHGRRIVAWLSTQERSTIAAAGRLHEFRQAVLRRYPDAIFLTYPGEEEPPPSGRRQGSPFDPRAAPPSQMFSPPC